MDAREKNGDSIDLSFSLGLIATKQGDVRDVIPGSPAYAAGLGPGMKLIAVNGRKWSKDVVRAALRAVRRIINSQSLCWRKMANTTTPIR